MSSATPFSNLEPTSGSVMDEYIPGEFGEESLPADFTEPVTTKIQDRSAASPPVLILASPQLPEARIGTFFWLAHALGLDMYGTSTLSYAARLEMTSAALVLTIIFLFDAGAWCLLFYFILNSGSLDLHPGRMLLSLGGILPALALLLYERGFMTADTRTHGWRRLVFPTALRVCVIFGAGWITAQPVELMAFARRIERRVQDELIRKDIVGHYHKLKKAEEEQKKGSIQLVKHDEHDLNVVQQDLTDKNSRLAAVDADLEKSKKAQSTGEARLQQAR